MIPICKHIIPICKHIIPICKHIIPICKHIIPICKHLLYPQAPATFLQAVAIHSVLNFGLLPNGAFLGNQGLL